MQHGPSVSTELIASQLGVSSQALLKRFQTKRELLLAAIFPPETAAWIPVVEAGPDDRPVRLQLSEIVELLAEYYVDIARRMSVLQFAGFGPEDLKGRYTELPPLRNIRIVASACHETGLVLVWPPEQLGPACEEFILRHATSMENARQVA